MMRIGHYAPKIWANGGLATYISRLGDAQAEAGNVVFYIGGAGRQANGVKPPASGTYLEVQDDLDLFKRAHDLGLDILHLHKLVNVLPPDRVPMVRTMHDNHGSCPTGSRYLARTGQACNRTYSVTGCLWGLLVDRCGNRRPSNIQASFSRIRQEMRLASELHTFTVSQFLRDQMVRSGCPAGKLQVLHSPAPDVQEAFVPPPREGAPRFLFLGRMVPQKGLGWLLRTVAAVKANVHLDVAGDGDLMSDMQRLATSLGLADRVTFHGWVSPTEVGELIQAARAVIFPSLWHEPAGLVTLEAAAWGRPVIASAVGGIPEYATSEFALLVPPNDENRLAGSITRLADDRELAERMGRNGVQLARTRFSMKNFMRELEQFYALALGAHAGEGTAHKNEESGLAT